MLYGSSASCGDTRQDINLNIGTHDLTSEDSVGVQVSENGDVYYYVNGQEKGVVFPNLPQHQDLWGVVYLLRATTIQSEFHWGEEMVYVKYIHHIRSLIDCYMSAYPVFNVMHMYILGLGP